MRTRRRDVTPSDFQTEEFEHYRDHLRSVAYRMLGSTTEADDAIQEAWLRLSRSDTGSVTNLGGWLTTVVARVCLDMLRSRRARREDYVGTWLPEPVVSVADGPEDEAALADAVGSRSRRPGHSDPSRAARVRPTRTSSSGSIRVHAGTVCPWWAPRTSRGRSSRAAPASRHTRARQSSTAAPE